MRSLLCYKFQCSSCNSTKRHFKVCVSEHMRVSASTDENIKSTKYSAVCDPLSLLKTFLFWQLEPMTLEYNSKKVIEYIVNLKLTFTD